MMPFYLWVVVYEIRRYRQISPRDGDSERKEGDTNDLAFMAVAIASVAAFSFFGAVPATIATLVAGLVVLGVRQASILVLLPPGVTIVLWLVFAQGFGIRVPLFLLPW
jgi:hypothetical protein